MLFFFFNNLQKEPKLNTKLRRDETLTTRIKTERISTDAAANESKVAEVNETRVEPIRNVRVKKEKDDTQAASKSTVAQPKAANETKKKLSKDSMVCVCYWINSLVDVVSSYSTDK